MSSTKKIAKDAYLFREGDPPDAMYIIKTGQFAITKTKGNSEVTLAEISVGQMVGEMAIFDRKARSANVKAVKDSEVVCLPYDALEKQLDAVPVWIKAIMRTLNENLREANKKIKILESTDTDQSVGTPFKRFFTVQRSVSTTPTEPMGTKPAPSRSMVPLMEICWAATVGPVHELLVQSPPSTWSSAMPACSVPEARGGSASPIGP